ncbi:MAG: hypothetical protein EBS90_12930, partial [Betaproteobacteria bacterium]|nr:hypothetical protein [Betaproteobacteria bacterium]
GDEPASVAWKKAEEAKSRGFQALRQETAQWWEDYYERSAVSLPDPDLQKWFARSTYYMGVFFGNTDVPPGCNGTSIESFAGAICPEYDLVLNQLALLYGNHFKEARRVVGWLERVLPRAERYAKEGLTLHQTSVKYSKGAKFGPLMGYDGTILIPPTTGEGIWAHEDFAGNNAALMALNVEDLQWRDDFKSYLNKNMPATVQQAGTLFGLRESVRRGVAQPDWAEKAGKILIPTAEYKGKKLLAVGPGAKLEENSGDSTWLSPVWYYRVLSDDDPIVRDSYDLFRTSKTGNYTFNKGCLRWAKNFLQPGVTLFDDTCFGELVADFEDFKKTPEVAAHAAFICNLTQMLLGSDDEKEISIFPAIPREWEKEGVSFQNLACRGNLLVSAEFSADRLQVKLENRSSQGCVRNLRVSLPEGTTRLRESEEGLKIENGWALLSNVKVPAKEIRALTFTASKQMESAK